MTWLFIMAFSPNSDGINDYFTIQGIEKYQNHTLQIFNRWGALVFESTAYNNDWDGSWAGAQLPDGTYFYVLQYGGSRSLSGYLQLNR
jgi:gliding motility-associated-like protein